MLVDTVRPSTTSATTDLTNQQLSSLLTPDFLQPAWNVVALMIVNQWIVEKMGRLCVKTGEKKGYTGINFRLDSIRVEEFYSQFLKTLSSTQPQQLRVDRVLPSHHHQHIIFDHLTRPIAHLQNKRTATKHGAHDLTHIIHKYTI